MGRAHGSFPPEQFVAALATVVAAERLGAGDPRLCSRADVVRRAVADGG